MVFRMYALNIAPVRSGDDGKPSCHHLPNLFERFPELISETINELEENLNLFRRCHYAAPSVRPALLELVSTSESLRALGCT